MKHKLEISFQQFSDVSELLEDERLLLEEAEKIAGDAYAPYSQFQVGCAVALSSGDLYLGNNQENRAYPSGLCAERTALFHIGSKKLGKEIEKMAIYGRSIREGLIIEQPVTPCGACRQVMAEYEEIADREIVVLMRGQAGPILRLEGIRKSLLPFVFAADF